MKSVRQKVEFHGQSAYYLYWLTQNQQFVRKKAGFHGQVIQNQQLVRQKAGFYGRITLPRQQESGKAVCRIVQNPSEDNGRAAKEYREHQEALKRKKRKEAQRIAEGCRECQVTKRRREHKRRDGEMRKSR